MRTSPRRQCRAAFLQQTAKPVTITNLKAEDVLIRMIGDDFAIIHARTAYTRPDGSAGGGSLGRKISGGSRSRTTLR